MNDMMKPEAAPASTLWTYQDVAAYLRLTVRTVYALTKTGDLPAVRIGPGSVRFHPGDVTAFVESRRTGDA